MKQTTSACLIALYFCIAVAGAQTKPVKQNPPVFKPDTGHGGDLQPVGDKHVELMFEKTGRVRAYILGKNPTEIGAIPAIELSGEILVDGATGAVPITLLAASQPGEASGMASQFGGPIPAHLLGRMMTISINVPIDGHVYRARFHIKTKAPIFAAHTGSHETLPAMPAATGLAEERKLFMTPGGRYTASDIKANGPLTPSQKYGGAMASHVLSPKRGDRICPITKTGANPKFTWIVDGKKYLFCCPPCIVEFVGQAKKSRSALKPPESYIQK
jgi:hypothetical protein